MKTTAHAAGLALAGAVACLAGCRGAPSSHAPGASADLEPFLRSYFASWSAGDMEAYRGHFDERARIALLKDGRLVYTMERDRFVDGQAALQSKARTKAVERMTSFTADEDAKAATVTARWELVRGAETKTGVDRFTLVRDERGKWKIVSLVFYADGRE
ncbi:MAG: nuclear transport factor 2 family protein [Planctomycetota bacterium]